MFGETGAEAAFGSAAGAGACSITGLTGAEATDGFGAATTLGEIHPDTAGQPETW